MNGTNRAIVAGVAEMQSEDPKIAPAGEDPVLASAAALAERLGARLHVAQAFERPDSVLAAYTHAMDDGTAGQHRKTEIERRLWAQTRRFPRSELIRCHAVEGRADLQLCAFAEEVAAELLIVGATRRGWVWHNLLGSTAERVLQHATVPVLVVRRPCARPVRRVLLTTDLSDLSPALHEAALDTVEKVFDSGTVEVRTLLVCQYDVVSAARMSREFMTRTATSTLQQFLAERHRRRFPVAGKIRIGNPSDEISGEVEEWNADLLILGTGSPAGVSRLLLGSTAAATLRGSGCNALVVPRAVAAAWQSRTVWNQRQGEVERPFPGTEEHHIRDEPLIAS